ncbi:hypothetical protein [Halalkalibacter wakoensis]|uniref:hypothetical protein n=1 Tax=Halalkalibacter wakoensis TaxID=127891 RepID=UPI00055440CD|nr:hypothetical protein [Halalkalibacter wakoensis]
MEKLKPITFLTGFSSKDKSDVIRKIRGNSNKQLKVILYRPLNFKLEICSEDPFSIAHFISEAVHQEEINTLSNLLTALEKDSLDDQLDEVILDLYPLTDLNSLPFLRR